MRTTVLFDVHLAAVALFRISLRVWATPAKHAQRKLRRKVDGLALETRVSSGFEDLLSDACSRKVQTQSRHHTSWYTALHPELNSACLLTDEASVGLKT